MSGDVHAVSAVQRRCWLRRLDAAQAALGDWVAVERLPAEDRVRAEHGDLDDDTDQVSADREYGAALDAWSAARDALRAVRELIEARP